MNQFTHICYYIYEANVFANIHQVWLVHKHLHACMTYTNGCSEYNEN